jgi:hypothetical protein
LSKRETDCPQGLLWEVPDPHAAEFGPPELSLTVGARVRASVWDAWRIFDTERVTIGARDLRRYEEAPQDDGSVRRTGVRLTLLRANHAWEEHTYDFVAPAWSFIDRRHTRGPLAREVFVQRVVNHGDETEATLTLHMWARGAASRALLRASRGPVRRTLQKVHLDFARQLEARLERRDAVAAPDEASLCTTVGPRPPPLSRKARRLLQATRAGFSSEAFAAALADYLAIAPLIDQDRMEPRVLARAWGLSADEVIIGCLEAVREGVLALRWDLLCPSCEGAKARWATLDETGREVHCTSCNIRYDAGFLNAVAVSFRPAPAVRDFHYERQCIGSPYHTPHVVARMRLEPGADREFHLDLEPGNYRIRDLRSLDAANLEVVAGAGHRALTVEVSDRVIGPPVLRAQSGCCAVALRSRISVPTWVVLEERWRPPTTLTAAQLLSSPEASALLPAEALGPTVNVEFRQSSVFVSEIFGGGAASERVASAVAALSPSDVIIKGRHLIAQWEDISGALRAAKQLDGMLEACSAAGQGMILNLGDHACPGGEAVDEALAALRISVPGFATLPGGCASDERVKAALDHASIRARLIPGPRLGGRQDYLISFERRGPQQTSPSPAGASTSSPSLEGQRLLDRYVVSGVVGEGGAGTVYEATDERTGDPLVIKVFKPIWARSAPALQQCFNEARTCSLLDHPNVVRLVDFGHTDDGRPLLVMERLHGKELKALLQEARRLDVTSTCLIGRDIAAALEAVHAVGVIHRDIKPSNIILVGHRPAQAKLIDFGIALELAQLEELGLDRSGTPMYLSPEQLQRRKPSPRSDLYALGLTLHECLTGALPNAQVPRTEALKLRTTDPLPPIDTVMSTPPPPLLGYVIDRCLALYPEDRLASAAEVRELLDEVLAELRVPA